MWTSTSDAFERKDTKREQVLIRDFARGDNAEVRRIFTEGIMERIPNTAFRGLKHQPHTQFIYAVLTGKRRNGDKRGDIQLVFQLGTLKKNQKCV